MTDNQTYYAYLMVGLESYAGASDRVFRLVSIPDRSMRLWINTILEEMDK